MAYSANYSSSDGDDNGFTTVTYKKKRSLSAPQAETVHPWLLGLVDQFDSEGNPSRAGWTEARLSEAIDAHLQGPNGHRFWPIKLKDAKYSDIFFHFTISREGKWSSRRIIFKHIDRTPGREAVVGRMMVTHGGDGANVWTWQDPDNPHARLLPHFVVPIGQKQAKPPGHPADCQHEVCRADYLKLRHIQGLDFDHTKKSGSMVVLFEKPIRIPLWQFKLDADGDRVMPFLGQIEDDQQLKQLEWTAVHKTPQHILEELREFNDNSRKILENHSRPRSVGDDAHAPHVSRYISTNYYTTPLGALFSDQQRW